MRRLGERVVACILLALTAPVLVLVALAIKCESPGPVLNRETCRPVWPAFSDAEIPHPRARSRTPNAKMGQETDAGGTIPSAQPYRRPSSADQCGPRRDEHHRLRRQHPLVFRLILPGLRDRVAHEPAQLWCSSCVCHTTEMQIAEAFSDECAPSRSDRLPLIPGRRGDALRLSGDVETDRNAVVMVEPFAQLVQGISEFPADKFDLDLVHRLALLGIRYSRSYSITTADSGLTRCSPELRRLLVLAQPTRECKAGGYCAVGTIRLQNRTVPAVGTMLDWANLR